MFNILKKRQWQLVKILFKKAFRHGGGVGTLYTNDGSARRDIS